MVMRGDIVNYIYVNSYGPTHLGYLGIAPTPLDPRMNLFGQFFVHSLYWMA